jgi:dTMP kinase
MQGVWPSLVVFIEAHPDTVAGRLDGRHLDRFERAGDDFHARVLEGYRAMADADPQHWIVVTTEGSKEVIAAEVLDAVRRHLARQGVDG